MSKLPCPWKKYTAKNMQYDIISLRISFPTLRNYLREIKKNHLRIVGPKIQFYYYILLAHPYKNSINSQVEAVELYGYSNFRKLINKTIG